LVNTRFVGCSINAFRARFLLTIIVDAKDRATFSLSRELVSGCECRFPAHESVCVCALTWIDARNHIDSRVVEKCLSGTMYLLAVHRLCKDASF